MMFIDYLVSDDKDLCQLAYERGSLTKLADTVKAITPSEATAEWDEDEPESISCLREVSIYIVLRIFSLDRDDRHPGGFDNNFGSISV